MKLLNFGFKTGLWPTIHIECSSFIPSLLQLTIFCRAVNVHRVCECACLSQFCISALGFNSKMSLFFSIFFSWLFIRRHSRWKDWTCIKHNTFAPVCSQSLVASSSADTIQFQLHTFALLNSMGIAISIFAFFYVGLQLRNSAKKKQKLLPTTFLCSQAIKNSNEHEHKYLVSIPAQIHIPLRYCRMKNSENSRQFSRRRNNAVLWRDFVI